MSSLTPFVSRIDLGNALGLDLTDNDYALVCVDAACDICRDLSGQDFNFVEDDQITLDGSGSDSLVLPQLPVTEISAVTLDDEALVADDDYRLNGHGVLLRTWPAVWRKARQNVVVTYSHGYSDATLPRSVRITALEIAKRQFSHPTGITSETLGQRSVTYASGSSDLSKNEERVLAKYRQTYS